METIRKAFIYLHTDEADKIIRAIEDEWIVYVFRGVAHVPHNLGSYSGLVTLIVVEEGALEDVRDIANSLGVNFIYEIREMELFRPQP